jgi:hypothetical protein
MANATVDNAARKALLKAIEAQYTVSKAADEATEGFYTLAVKFADKCGEDHAKFHATFDAVFNAIRTNQGGVAERMKAEPAKGEGFKVPNAASAARSTIKRAHSFGISTRDENGNLRSFGDIKTLAKEAAQLKKAENMSDADRTAIALADKLAKLASEIRAGVDGDGFDEFQGDALEAFMFTLDAWSEEFDSLSGDDDSEDDDAVEAAAAA